jgi:hypothetical protein
MPVPLLSESLHQYKRPPASRQGVGFEKIGQLAILKAIDTTNKEAKL